MNSCIYIIENSSSYGKVYIGSATEFRKRAETHMRLLSLGKHHSKKLQHSYNKHGAEHFTIRPLFYCAPKDLLFYEQRAIDIYKAATEGYNINPTAGSNAGRKWSKEVRARMSASGKGKRKPLSALHRIGRVASNEHRANISKALNGIVRSPQHMANISSAKIGKKLSLETRLKMSAVRKGKKQSQETIAKRNASLAILRSLSVIPMNSNRSSVNGRFTNKTTSTETHTTGQP